MTSIEIFTDGSCIGNGKKVTSGGYGIHFPNGEFPDVSKSFYKKPVTNQRAELFAILVALGMTVDLYSRITIYTDSEYSIKSLTEWGSKWEKNGWKTSKKTLVKNIDIIKPLYRLYKKYQKRITLKHVRSHTGNDDYLSLGNAEADRLAVMGSKSNRIMRRPIVESSNSDDDMYETRVIIKRRRSAPKKKSLRIKTVYAYSDDESD